MKPPRSPHLAPNRVGRNLLVALPILVVGGLGYAAYREARTPRTGDPYVLVGREHVRDGSPVATTTYSSNPPTSGTHWLDPKRPGVYSEPIPDAQAVHNLEHSHVWLSYRDPSDTTTVAALAAIAARHPGVILVSPRPANDAPIAVAAWGRLLKLQTVDGEQIERFITDSLHKGPEDVPMQGV